MSEEKYGDRIASLRKRMNLTQDKFAEKSGISRAALSHYEKSRREPDFETLKRIAMALGTTTDYIIGFIATKKPCYESLFGERLRILRLEKALTQSELGEALNKTKNNISQYETGKRSPSITTLVKLAIIFSVTIDYLVGYSNYKNI